jgi:vesicle-fusing ATPase
MRQTPEDDTYLYTREQLENQIAVMMAGAAAEEIILGNRSTGSAGDFDQAVRTAETMLRSGMSELGVVSLDSLPQEMKHRTLTSLVKKQEERVSEYITNKKHVFDKIMEVLMEKEKISGEQFRSLLQ